MVHFVCAAVWRGSRIKKMNELDDIKEYETVSRTDHAPVVELLKATKIEASKQAAHGRPVRLGFGVVLVICLLFPLRFHHGNIAVWVFVAAMAVQATLTTRNNKKLRELEKGLKEQLALCDDKRAVGALVEALAYDPSTADAAVPALTRLLPRLYASDQHLLTTAQRAMLYKYLTTWRADSPIRLQLARTAVNAFRDIGDAGALPVVEKLANGEGTGKDYAVRSAAFECLPYLKEVARQEETHRTLLRASAPGELPQALLRPASAALDNPADQMLRATTDRSNGFP